MIFSKRSRGRMVSFITIFVLTQCQKSSFVDDAPIVDAILHDESSFFYVDTEHYPEGDRSLPIGVFDSGTGGLTVLDAIVRFDRHDNDSHNADDDGDGVVDFREESFIYLGDQANMPYGTYESEGKTGLLKEHILKDVQFLLGKRYYRTAKDAAYQMDKSPVKAVVIACNTATAYGKEDIEKFMAKAGLDIPVIGVIDAGVRGALSVLDKDEDGSIAIFATEGTVASMGYVMTLERQKKALEYTGRIDAFQQAGVGIAGAVEGAPECIAPGATSPRDGYKGPSETNPNAMIDLSILGHYGFDWKGGRMLFEGDASSPKNPQINSVKNYIAFHVVSLMEQIRKTPGAKPLKAVILGCTHYPFYTDIFRKELDRLAHYEEDGTYVYRGMMSEHIAIIDPAENTAIELYDYLKEKNLFDDDDLCSSEFYISVPNVLNDGVVLDTDRNFTYSYKYGREMGRIQEYVKCVPFSRISFSTDTIQMLAEKIPSVYRIIGCFHRENLKTVFLKDVEKF